MTDESKEFLTSLLEKVAKTLNLKNYSLNLNLNAALGDGFLSEFYKISILDKDSNKTYNLAVKRAPQNENYRKWRHIVEAFHNEIYFYKEVFPTIDKFQREHNISEPFKSLPRFFSGDIEVGREVIALEDVTFNDFILREKDLLLDDEHAKAIFKTYGKFHALSFAFKDQQPEKYKKLTQNIPNDVWMLFMSDDGPIRKQIINTLKEKVPIALKTSSTSVVKSYQKWIDNGFQLFLDAYKLNELDYTGILHGDCWSNNMMFRYKDPKTFSGLEDITLLDFQLTRVGSVCHDLSYFFYSGGSKEIFVNLEDYLDIYYESFSATVNQLGSDPQKIFPREVLTQQWKRYSRYGMCMAIMLSKVKLMDRKDLVKMRENQNKTGSMETKHKLPYDEDLYHQRLRDIVEHLHEINAL